MEAQVGSAPLARFYRISQIWICGVSQRGAQRAAMFSCRAAWQRCGPLARRAAYRLPRNGEFAKAAFGLDVVWGMFSVNVIRLTVTERGHPVPRSGPAWNTSRIGVFSTLILSVHTYETHYHLFNILSYVLEVQNRIFQPAINVPTVFFSFFMRFKLIHLLMHLFMYLFYLFIYDVIHPHKRMCRFKGKYLTFMTWVGQHGCRYWSRGVSVKHHKEP